MFNFSDTIKNIANVGLLSLTILAVYSHYMVDDMLERTAPALVFLFMLSGRLVVYWQVFRQGKTTTTSTDGKPADGTTSSFMGQSNGYKQD